MKKKFKDLKQGEIFDDPYSKSIMMKISGVFPAIHVFNGTERAVCISEDRDGSLIAYDPNEEVFLTVGLI